MSMRTRMAKGISYEIAPRTTFAALHPGRTRMGRVAERAIDRLNPAVRRRQARRRSALTGIGAAIIALPVGLWLGRRMNGSRQHLGQM